MREGINKGAAVALVLAFLPLWGLQVYYWWTWWGPVGFFLGTGAIPVALLLPIICLAKTGLFSYLLFGLMAAVITASITFAKTSPESTQ